MGTSNAMVSPGRARAYAAASLRETLSPIAGSASRRLLLEATASSLTRIWNAEVNLNGRLANHPTMRSLNELSPPGLSRRPMSAYWSAAAEMRPP
jgi:hypothetical protein